MDRTKIVRNRENKDWDVFVDGEYIGSREHYAEAEQLRTEALARLDGRR